jgi:hypothetical protein
MIYGDVMDKQTFNPGHDLKCAAVTALLVIFSAIVFLL